MRVRNRYKKTKNTKIKNEFRLKHLSLQVKPQKSRFKGNHFTKRAFLFGDRKALRFKHSL